MTVKTVTYYKCDRCGRRFRHQNEIRKIRFSKWSRYCEDYVPEIKDLCEECTASFTEWLGGDA